MANLITYSRMVFVVPIGWAMYSNEYNLALILFILASLTDWLDGFVARKYNLVTEAGKVMDQIADKVLVNSVLVFMVDLQEIPSWLLVTIIWRDFLVSATRILAAKSGRIISANVFGKFKTVLQMALIIWILARDIWSFNPITTFLVWAVFLSTVLSGFLYLYQNRFVFKT